MNNDVKKFLEWTGIIGAGVSAISYIIVTAVIIMGFQSSIDRDKQLLFAILGAVTGLLITFFLRQQGITFAKKDPDAKKVMENYYNTLNKKKTIKQLHTIKWFMFWQTLKDIFMKGLSVASSTWFVLYIFMEGNGDYALFWLAISNILMFACFGLIAMSKSYDKYLEEHIPAIKQIIIKLTKDPSIDPTGDKSSEKGETNANLSKHEISQPSTESGEEQARA